MLTADAFLKEIEAFLTRSGMSASAFGRAAVGDPNLVLDLRDGRKPNLGLVEKIDAFIKEQDAARVDQRAEAS